MPNHVTNQPVPDHQPFKANLHWLRSIVLILTLAWCTLGDGKPAAHANILEDLSLDSIAAWGKFPRFCINTYRWGDKFFNNYDSTYVIGSGYRFNIKAKADSYIDRYDFEFTDGYKIGFNSRPSTSMGLWLTYMAVSVGYDINFSKIFNADIGARKRFNFQFNCALFGAEIYTITDDSYMKITRLGYPHDRYKVAIDYRGFHSDSWGLNLYYFFNHRHYSQAAAFSYSKIQVKSSGSLYAGFAYWARNYDMDFSNYDGYLPHNYKLPTDWGTSYRVRNRNYAIKIGYAYNWVFHRGWCLGVSEAPVIGLRRGYISAPDKYRNSFALNNRFLLSLVYNHGKRWFFGTVCTLDTSLLYDREHTMMANNFSVVGSAGFRFNLW